MKLILILVVYLGHIYSQSFLQFQLEQQDYLEASSVADYFQKLDIKLAPLKEHDESNINFPREAFELASKEILCDRISVNGIAAKEKNHYIILKEHFDHISLSADSEERQRFFDSFTNLLQLNEKRKAIDYEYFAPFDYANGSCDSRSAVFGEKLMAMKKTKAFLSISLSKGMSQDLKTNHKDCKDFSDSEQEIEECKWGGHIAPIVFSDDKIYVFDPTVKKMKDGSVAGDAFINIHEWVKFLIDGDLNAKSRSSSMTFIIHITKHLKTTSPFELTTRKLNMIDSYLMKQLRLFWFERSTAEGTNVEGRNLKSTWKSTYCNKDFWKLKSGWLGKLTEKAKIQAYKISKFKSLFKGKKSKVHPFADNSKPEL